MSGDMSGRVIKGRFKLIDELGRGSFATVYIARDTKTNRIYAMKVMHFDLADDGELLARFQREAHILQTLIDPHIVRIFEYGDEDDLHYILMDYIDGQNLKYFTLTHGPMELGRALDYTHQIAEGLDTAFKHGVVHRDIKPQNIVINSKDVAKITDFGLARSRETVTLTQTNVFMGTAYYIPPEQAESGRSADIRSDLYSLGTVLFEMLSGHPPFEGDTAVDIVLKHMNQPVPSLRSMRSDMPPELDRLLQKAMAKSSADRFATPQEFINALEQVQQLVPTIERQETLERGVVKAGNGKRQERKKEQEQQAEMITPVSQLTPVQRIERERSAQPMAQKQANLLVLSNNQSIPLTGELMVVGRHDPVLGIYPEVNLADKTVGRRHAYLRYQQGHYTVEDLNALNKTRLNGIILTPHEERTLKDGDILRFGSVEVRFELK